MGTAVEKEREQFEAMMARSCARLTDFARPYTGRLAARERDEFWQRALHEAWLRRVDFHPESHSILQWWDGCLRATALAKDTWTVVRFDGSRRKVSGRRLGKER